MGRLSIHLRADGASAVHQTGFSWLAALALPLWALQHRLYKTCAVVVPAGLVLHDAVGRALLSIADESVRGLAALAWLLAWSLLTGAFANAWHLHVLRRGGYELSSAEPEAAA